MSAAGRTIAPERPPTHDKTVADTAYRALRHDLLNGTLAPAARLRLKPLQARYQLGLSPLREALLRLSSEGFVVAEGQRGFAVAPASLDELLDLTRVRQQIEPLALAQAIERGDASWQARVRDAYAALASTPMPGGPAQSARALAWEQAHRAFHDALNSACGSPWLIRLLGQLTDHAKRYRQQRLMSAVSAAALQRQADAEHRALMEAVLARDAARAVSLMHEHLEGTARAALRSVPPG